MLGIVTTPDFYPDEALQLKALFEAGLQRLHLRKPCHRGRHPEKHARQLFQLLDALPECTHAYIVLHGKPDLLHTARSAPEMHKLAGWHHSGWSKDHFPFLENTMNSYPVHTPEELAYLQQQNRVPKQNLSCVISPVFRSISKANYPSGWTAEQLLALNKAKHFPHYALGGISAQTLEQAGKLGFDGLLCLGAVWGKAPQNISPSVIANNYQKLLNMMNHE